MSHITRTFERINGRPPSAEETIKLERLITALDTTPDDALLAVFLTLDHYERLYEAVPSKIHQATQNAVSQFKKIADAQAQASIAEAKADLAKAVAKVAIDVAKTATKRQLLEWIAISLSTATFCFGIFGWYMHKTGYESGYGVGQTTGYEIAKNEKAAAAWANTPEGRLAYRFAQTGSLSSLARCDRPGWITEKGACYVKRAPNGNIYGWILPK